MSNYIDFMIDANELNKLLKTKKEIVIIDVRSEEDYNNGHIDSAVNFPAVFTYLPNGRTTKKEKKDFIKFYEILFSKAGVNKNELVVFYEDKFTLKSPRGLTILKYLGYDEKNIKVLDGGYITWLEAGFKISKNTTHNIAKEFIPNIDESFFVDYDEMLSFIDNPKIIKLDVRDKDEWVGISSSPYGIDFAPKKGRLPNAIWIEWYHFITSNMLSVESLEKIKKELEKKNIKKDDDIVLYCFKGARLSNSYIALRKLGYKQIRIYFAGWNEWCRKKDAPIINEVENNDNPLLQENIALKNKLEAIHLKDANLIDFPKYNKEPVFAFDRSGNIVFENNPKKVKLPNIIKISDIYSDLEIKDVYNIIDNRETRTTVIQVEDRYFLLNIIGSREVNRILVYAFETTEIEKSHKKIKASIEYASLIQNAILPATNVLNNCTKENFTFWKPRDTVGGDIYFITELNSKEELLVMVIDGAGHGVPGAFVTMLVKAIENQIIAEIKAKMLNPSPALILEYFNKSIKTMLKQEKGSPSNAGFDGGVLYYNKATNVCKYAGAKTPLYIINNGEVEVLQSDRKHVGFARTKIDQIYTEYDVEIKEDTQLYIATDGMIDQEGENDTFYGKKEFERMLLRNSHKTMQEQKENIIQVFEEFKSDCEQSDDVTIVGLRF